FRESDADTDEGNWLFAVTSGQLRIATASDAAPGTVVEDAMRAIRTGTNIDSIALAADAITLNGVNVTDYARKSQSNTFATHQVLANNVVLRGQDTEGAAHWMVGLGNDDEIYFGGSSAGLDVNILGGNVSVSTGGTFSVSGAALVPTIANSTSETLVPGQIHHVDGNCTVPTLAAGQWVAIVNHSASPITLTRRSGTALYWTATGADSATVTIPARGRVVVSCAATNSDYVGGDITGNTT